MQLSCRRAGVLAMPGWVHAPSSPPGVVKLCHAGVVAFTRNNGDLELALAMVPTCIRSTVD